MWLDSRSHVRQLQFEAVNMLKVKNRIQQLKQNQIFKITDNLAPQYLHSNFIRIIDSRQHHTRNTLIIMLHLVFAVQPITHFCILPFEIEILYQNKTII